MKKLLVLLYSCLLPMLVSAQSQGDGLGGAQFSRQPLFLNPALAGNSGHRIRAGVFLKNQRNLRGPNEYAFNQFHAYADAPLIIRSARSTQDMTGLGLGFSYTTGKGQYDGFAHKTFAGHGAFHLQAGESNILSFGLSGGLMRGVSDTSMPTAGLDASGTDFAVGVHWTLVRPFMHAGLGASMAHAGGIDLTFAGPMRKVDPRQLVHADVELYVANVFNFGVSGYYTRQADSSYYLGGAYVTVGDEERLQLLFGIYGGRFMKGSYRAGLEFSGISVMFTFEAFGEEKDSGIGFELSLVYRRARLQNRMNDLRRTLFSRTS